MRICRKHQHHDDRWSQTHDDLHVAKYLKVGKRIIDGHSESIGHRVAESHAVDVFGCAKRAATTEVLKLEGIQEGRQGRDGERHTLVDAREEICFRTTVLCNPRAYS